MFRYILILIASLLVPVSAQADFSLQDQNGSILLSENDRPVLVYHYAPVPAPLGTDSGFCRGSYIHPLYGLDGEIMTDDFPADHLHHRGIFWAWPECSIDGRRLDPWALKDARPHHDKFLYKKADSQKATICVQNHWAFDDAPDKAIIREKITFTAYPEQSNRRFIDFVLVFTNVSNKTVTFLGAKNKGYGGFCYRPDASPNRRPLKFTHAMGTQSPGEDLLRCDSPWTDLTTQKPFGGRSGIAIFQNHQNPGYPHPGWMMRHYGFLGVSWPHEQTYELLPGKHFCLIYRVVIHRGSAEEADIAHCFEAYAVEKE